MSPPLRKEGATVLYEQGIRGGVLWRCVVMYANETLAIDGVGSHFHPNEPMEVGGRGMGVLLAELDLHN